MKFYITFGQIHVHSVNGKTFDKDTIAVIEAENRTEARGKAVKYFGDKFYTDYSENEWKEEDTKYFPKGFVNVENR